MSAFEKLARKSPAAVGVKTKSLRQTYGQLRCGMGWRLKARLDFLAKAHGVDLSHLVSELLEGALEQFEPHSRANATLEAAWLAFDAKMAEADAEEDAIRRARRASEIEVLDLLIDSCGGDVTDEAPSLGDRIRAKRAGEAVPNLAERARALREKRERK